MYKAKLLERKYLAKMNIIVIPPVLPGIGFMIIESTFQVA